MILQTVIVKEIELYLYSFVRPYYFSSNKSGICWVDIDLQGLLKCLFSGFFKAVVICMIISWIVH